MSRVLMEIPGQGLAEAGFTPDLKNRTAPLWVDGQNMILDHKGIRPIPGQELFLNDPAQGTVMGIATARLGRVGSVFWGTTGKLYRYTASGGTVQEGTGYTGQVNSVGAMPASMWSLERWGAWMAATNGVNQVQLWKTATGDFGNLAGSPPTYAEIAIARTPHMLLLNTSKGDNYIEWCKEDDIEDWTIGVGKTPGNIPVRDLRGPITAAKKLGSEIGFYTEYSQHLCYYGGAPFRFRNNPLSDKIGACGKQAVVVVGEHHYGMDQQKIWKSNGSQWVDLCDDRVSKWIYDDFNVEQRSKVVLQYVPQINCVAVYFPSAASLYNDRCAIYNCAKNWWNPPATLERSAADQEPSLTWVLSGNRSGYLFDWSARGVPVPASNPGQLPLPVGGSYFLGWGYGGWGLFPWGGPTVLVTG